MRLELFASQDTQESIAELEQRTFDLGEEQARKGEELEAVRQLNRELMAKVSRPRELLAPSLLLLLAESPGHGYELMERLRPLGFDWGGAGPIYRDLRLLEDAGLITSDWFVGQSGPGRRVYEITASGRESLDRSIAGVRDLQRFIAEYEARVRAIARPKPPAASGARRQRRAPSRNGGS